jgi:KaiC/GvpD/RAD55 family RecA-like ATPase
LTDRILQEAERRALDLSHEEFRDQVAAFLPSQSHARSTAQWEHTQVSVASFVDKIKRQSLAPGQAPELPRHCSEPGE